VEQVQAILDAQQRLRDRFLFALLFETGMRQAVLNAGPLRVDVHQRILAATTTPVPELSLITQVAWRLSCRGGLPRR